MISIVNYGLGNVQALANLYHRLNIPVEVVDNASALSRAKKVILPGVGAFDWAMTRLIQTGIRQCLESIVFERKIPILGICVGMQIMAKSSDEGALPGLGWFDATVKKFNLNDVNVPLPHMGWNDVTSQNLSPLFLNMGNDSRFYFLHSYYFEAAKQENIIATTDYYGPFAAAVSSGNIFGVQFHPEKSHSWGVQLLKNFAELSEC